MSAFICSISGCDRTDRGNAEWCRVHYMRWWRHGDPLVSNVAHRFVGAAVTYSGAHIRVRKTRGPASAHLCDCGEPARHWAYDHADENEKHDDRGRPYSPDPAHYQPMCVSCHKRADLAVKSAS